MEQNQNSLTGYVQSRLEYFEGHIKRIVLFFSWNKILFAW